MTPPLTLTIPGASLPSWNDIMRMHHHGQHTVHQSWMACVVGIIDADTPRFDKPVAIVVTSYQKGRLIDPDNIYAKGIIDGIKSRLFPDDSPRWVESVTLRSRKDKLAPRVVVEISEVEVSV